MAKLTIQPMDTGQIIPLGGTAFWDVIGTASVDSIDVAAGASAKLSLGAGIDIVSFAANASDYTVHRDGVNAVFTYTNGKTVTIPMTTAGDQLKFGTGSALDFNLKIDTSSGVPKFLLGTQELTTTPAPITGSGGSGSGSVLDGQGTSTTAALIDASTGAFDFTDSVLQSNNVRIMGFGADDRLTIVGGTAAQYDSVISSDASGNVTIAYNNAGVLSSIELVGAAAASDGTVGIVFDVATFNALSVGDLFFV